MTSATVFPDTKVLLNYQSLEAIDWSALVNVRSVQVVIAPVVLQQLGKVKNQNISPMLRDRARSMFEKLAAAIRQGGKISPYLTIKTMADPQLNYEAEGLSPSDPTDRLIASVIAYQRRQALEYVILLSNEPVTLDKAASAGIEVQQAQPRPVSQAVHAGGPTPAAPPPPADMQRLSEPNPLHDQISIQINDMPKSTGDGLAPTYLQDTPPAEPPPPAEHYPPPPPVQDPAPQIIADRAGDGVTPPVQQPPAETYAPTGMPLNMPAQRSTSIQETRLAAANEPNVSPLRLSFIPGAQRTNVLVRHPVTPSIDDVGQELAKLRKRYPKLSMQSIPKGVDPNDRVTATIIQRRNQRIKKYNDALSTYYTQYEKYLHDHAEFENQLRRSTRLQLALINDTDTPLRSLYISIQFPENVRVFSEDNVPERPIGPQPPTVPNFESTFDPIVLPRIPQLPELNQVEGFKLKGRHLEPAEIRWNKGWDVIYTAREVNAETVLPFNPIFLLFNSFDSAASFQIQYRITIASQSQEERGSLELVTRQVIQ